MHYPLHYAIQNNGCALGFNQKSKEKDEGYREGVAGF